MEHYWKSFGGAIGRADRCINASLAGVFRKRAGMIASMKATAVPMASSPLLISLTSMIKVYTSRPQRPPAAPWHLPHKLDFKNTRSCRQSTGRCLFEVLLPTTSAIFSTSAAIYSQDPRTNPRTAKTRATNCASTSCQTARTTICPITIIAPFTLRHKYNGGDGH